MKAIIIDDELHVRQGIRLLGEWARFNITDIYEAENGEQAKALLLTHRPQLVFTDMKMPKMDGTALLQWIKENGLNCKTIVVTGYNDYNYMRNAIQFGSFDYILKPIDPDVLNQTIERAIVEWQEAEKQRKLQMQETSFMNQIKPMYRDQKLKTLLKNPALYNPEYETELGIPENAVFSFVRIGVSQAAIDAVFAGEQELCLFSLANVVNEFCRSKGHAFQYYEENEIALLYWGEDIEHKMRRLLGWIQQYLEIKPWICIGRRVEGVISLLQTVESAEQVRQNMNVLRKNQGVYLEESSPIERVSLLDFTAEVEELVNTGSLEVYDNLVENVLQPFRTTGILPLEQIQQWEREYLVIRDRWLNRYGYEIREESVWESYWDVQSNFSLAAFLERKQSNVQTFLQEIKQRKGKQQNTMVEIEQYIKQNYQKELRLQEIAEMFYLSKEHISRRFKQEYGETLSDYVTNIRMEKAKLLLQNESFKIYEVAAMVGYQDDKYFRKVFKKATGITPNEYRAEYTQKK
ncbi:response regulator [Ectobacillus antri]|jgi:two-component system response regulator YesN|uniref:Response regulator n=1 Tax=Ectobacillus antri TaxID=2486280 RepID=A0ABT6H5S9_9BACI|nr:response regulator [Ectobacillus antri]MDG4657321.1 response regulator [Ectobacillus antri]MDG5754327.1 response regulator [Ectobacillus antri]